MAEGTAFGRKLIRLRRIRKKKKKKKKKKKNCFQVKKGSRNRCWNVLRDRAVVSMVKVTG